MTDCVSRALGTGSAAALSMGCCAMPLYDKTRKLVRVVTIFGMHEPLVLDMGVASASGFFQRRVCNSMMEVKSKPSK